MGAFPAAFFVYFFYWVPLTGDLVAKVTALDGITIGLLGVPAPAKDDYFCAEFVVILVGDTADMDDTTDMGAYAVDGN